MPRRLRDINGASGRVPGTCGVRRARLREGTSKPLFFGEGFHLGYRRAGAVRLVVARALYKDPEMPETTTVDKPEEILERGLLAPSMIAHLLVSKYDSSPTTLAYSPRARG